MQSNKKEAMQQQAKYISRRTFFSTTLSGNKIMLVKQVHTNSYTSICHINGKQRLNAS
jgi:hypothetical protein